jgi:O-antigen/teichoic acid export membrane protein
MANVRNLIRASSGYGLSVITGGLISIAVIPVVIIVAGPHTWATIAVAQGVAGFGMVVAGAGWGVTGPTETARLEAELRGQYYIDSVVSRIWLFIIVAAICSAITLLLVPSQPAIALLALISALVPALSAGFFFVGEKSPLRFLLIETLPRQAGSLVGALLLFVTGNALWFVGVQLLGGIVATIFASTDILRRYAGWRLDASLAPAFSRLRTHVPIVSMSAVSTLYVNLPIVVVQVFLPQATALYALAERIMRLGLYATRPYVQVTQSYVPHHDVKAQRDRAARVTKLSLVIGIAGGVAYAIAAPWVGLVLSGGQLRIDYSISTSLAFALAAMLISQVTGFTVLPTYRRIAAMTWSTVAGAVVGAAGLIPAALVFGLVGVTSVLALSEIVVLGVQLAVLPATLRRPYEPQTKTL